MDEDGDAKDDNKRRTRNLSEKKRRDQFNMLVTELSTLITTNNRKMDKSTVLKSTISFLKNHNEVTVRSRAHDVQEDWKPAFLSNEEFTYLVLEALEGFVMVFSASGRIYYVSESVTSLLGHNPVDLVNKSIFDLTYEEDQSNLYNLLQTNASAIEQMQNTEKEIIRFQIHFRRGHLDFSEEVSYDLVQFYGHFRTNQEQGEADRNVMGYQHQQDPESRILFVCIGRLHTPQLIRDVSLVDSSRNEFTSRHSLEWKFLFLDHRAPPIIGYLPFEVLGTSGYDYYHFDDLEKVVTCHQALMQKGELTSCYYRFLTKGQQWIWLQTRFYITYHQWNSKPEFVVCTHRVVSYADVVKTTKEEGIEQDVVNESCGEVSQSMKDTSDEPMPPMSPSYMSEASDAFGSSYQPIAQKAMKEPPPDDALPGLSPSYASETASDAYGNTYQLVSQSTLPVPPRSDRSASCRSLLRSDISETVSENTLQVPSYGNRSPSPRSLVRSDKLLSQNNFKGPLTDELPVLSPCCMSEAASDAFGNSYRASSQPASVKSASGGSTAGTVATAATAAATWGRALTRYTGGSDTTSLSGDSRSSQRNGDRERYIAGNIGRYVQGHKSECSLAPQHGIGAQYLAPAPYANTPPPGLLPLATLPVLVAADQAQIQEQLQRKHEELQQMIVRQQEELRQVKEQLLLARLGMLQPLINVPNPYSTPEDIQNQQRMTAQLGYTNAPARVTLPGYQQHVALPPLSTLTTLAPHQPHAPRPPHPSHPSDPHHHMPQ